MPTLPELRGNIPSLIGVFDGKLHKVNLLHLLIPKPAVTSAMDRTVLDFEPLFGLREASEFFIIRAKSNADLPRAYSAPSDGAQGVICDQTLTLSGFYSRKKLPQQVRRIRFQEPDLRRTLILLTNQFRPPPNTVCELPKAR